MSVYLDSVRISGIMGIPGDLSLDLTAPLTLIYAPNGTGKTSIWSAIKALMTMGVDDKIACQALGAHAATVAGDFWIANMRYTAKATHGNLTLTSEDGGSSRATTALKRLAPEVDTTGVQPRGGVLRDRLISQIEGCRFLPSESLVYLIDSGEESTELRRKLFADLTGTSSLQTEGHETKRYRDKLSDELGNVHRSLQTIEEQMQAFTAMDSPNLPDSAQLIAQAAAAAGIQIGPDVSTQDALSLLRSAQNSKAASLDICRAAYATCRSIEGTYPRLDHDLSVATATLKDANSSRERAEQALTRARDDLQSGHAKRFQQQYERFQRTLTRIAALVGAEDRTKQLMSSSVQSLRHMLRPYDSENAIESRLVALQQLDRSRQAYRDEMSERQHLVEKRERVVAEPHVASVDLQGRLNEKMVERSELVARISYQSNLATSLRASAQSLVEASRSSTCPCCSHHWQSVDALLAAIAEADRDGNTDLLLKRELEAVETGIGQLQVQCASAAANEEQFRQLEKRLDELQASIDRVGRLASVNGVSPTRLLDSTKTLEDLHTVQTALSLWRILKAVDDIGSDLDETQSIEAALLALSARGESLKNAAASAGQREVELRLLIDREQSALQSGIELASRCEEQVSKLTRVTHERDAATEQLRSNGMVAGSATQSTLNHDSTALAKLSSLITQVSAVVDASEAVAARERIAKNQKVLQTKQERLSQEVEQADRLIKILAQVEQKAGKQFFDRLGPAVGALFDHMQVNRVFRHVGITAAEESFRLNGQLDGDVSLDPGSQFSQGQRQDLALSMFLVRAASLGGSFFLDEPLVHLDDLNRTALLDCLRACVLGTASSPRSVRLVVTTANWSVSRHLIQKFYGVSHHGVGPWLRVIQLSGNVGNGVEQSVVFPAESESKQVLVH